MGFLGERGDGIVAILSYRVEHQSSTDSHVIPHLG